MQAGPSCQNSREMLPEHDGQSGNCNARQTDDCQVSVCSAVSQRLVALLHRTGREESTGCKHTVFLF